MCSGHLSEPPREANPREGPHGRVIGVDDPDLSCSTCSVVHETDEPPDVGRSLIARNEDEVTWCHGRQSGFDSSGPAKYAAAHRTSLHNT